MNFLFGQTNQKKTDHHDYLIDALRAPGGAAPS